MRSCLAGLACLALLVPGVARPCTLVSSGTQPRLTDLKVLVLQRADADEVAFQLTWDGGPAAGQVGALVPVPAGAALVESVYPEWENENLAALDLATTPQVRFGAAAGCGGDTPRVAPQVRAPRVEWGQRALPSELRLAGDAAEVDGWAEDHGFVLGGAARDAAAQVLSEGSALLLVVLDTNAAADVSALLRIRVPHLDRLALRTLAISSASPFPLTIFVGGPTTAHTEGWPLVALTDLDRATLRRTGSLARTVSEAAREAGGRLFLVASAEPSETLLSRWRTDGVWGADPGNLLLAAPWVTRLEAAFGPDLADRAVRLVADPAPREVSPILDLRPDPQAHGASLLGDGGPGPLVLLLGMAWLFLGRRRRGR